ncbi:MAG TPA: hypothetical protein VFU82_09005 [Gammaproteobacteria bacterium]|nr:hypothetical protein [Gammaproteobacteria bacterium]
MKTKNTNNLMTTVETLSDEIHAMLSSRSDDLDGILSKMQAREENLNQLIPQLSSDDKKKWTLILGMIRDKEAMALLPYRQDLVEVEDALIAIHQSEVYRGPGTGGDGT